MRCNASAARTAPNVVLTSHMQHVCGQDVPMLGVEIGLSRLYRLFIECGFVLDPSPLCHGASLGFGVTLNILKHCPQRETVFAGI